MAAVLNGESVMEELDDLKDLNQRLQSAEGRLNAVRTSQVNRQKHSFDLLQKLEERFTQQRQELMNAVAYIQKLEAFNKELVGKLKRLVSAAEGSMDAVDDMFYQINNTVIGLAEDVSSYKPLPGLAESLETVKAITDASQDVDGSVGPAPAPADEDTVLTGTQQAPPPPSRPATTRPAPAASAPDEEDGEPRVLKINSIFGSKRR